MVGMPCICSHCGARFVLPDVIGGSGSAKGLTFSGNRTGCPVCGDWADILDGVYDFSAEVLTVVSAPQRTIDELTRLRDTLADLAKLPESEQTVEAVTEAAPWLAPVIDKHGLQNWPALISVMLQLVSISLMLHPPAAAPSSSGETKPKVAVEVTVDLPKEELNEIVERAVVEAFKRQASTTSTTTAPVPPKPGRNTPCHCGSGRKYKHCHGAQTVAERP
jgi:SEC-C motif